MPPCAFAPLGLIVAAPHHQPAGHQPPVLCGPNQRTQGHTFESLPYPTGSASLALLPTPRSPALLNSIPVEILENIFSTGAGHTLSPHHDTLSLRVDRLRASDLRSLALVCRSWSIVAQRELAKAPTVDSHGGLNRFIGLVLKHGIAPIVRQLHLNGLEAARPVEEPTRINAPMGREVDRGTLEYAGELVDGLHLNVALPRLSSLRLSKFADVVKALKFAKHLPQLLHLTIQTCAIPNRPIQIPSTIRSLTFLHAEFDDIGYLLSNIPSPLHHLDFTLTLLDCTLTPGPAAYRAFDHPRSAINGSVLDAVTSLVLDTRSAAMALINLEHFPEVHTAEFLTVAAGSYRSVGVDEAAVPAEARQTLCTAALVLKRTWRLPKLEHLILPDEAPWRTAWGMAERAMADQGKTRPLRVDLVWK